MSRFTRRSNGRFNGGRGNSAGGRRVFNTSAPRGYKSDLNKLFETGQVPDRFKSLLNDNQSASSEGAERQQLIRQARQSKSVEEFNTVFGDLVSRFNLPDDQDLLLKGLDHPETDAVKASLDALIEMDGRRPLTKRAILKLKLDTVAQTSQDSEVLNLVEILRERL